MKEQGIGSDATYKFLAPKRLWLLVGGVCICAFGLVAGVACYPRWNAVDAHGVKKVAEDLLRDFQKSAVPLAIVSLGKLPAFEVANELVDPTAHFPHAFNYPYGEISGIYRYAKSCGQPPYVADSRSRKLLLWAEYQCGRLAALPNDFLAMPPFMHPSGASYAYLILQKGKGSGAFDLPRSKTYFHILELREQKDGLTTDERILSDLSPSQLEAVYFKASATIGPSYLLIATRGASEATQPTYQAFSRTNWQEFADQTFLKVKETANGTPPLVAIGNMAIDVNTGKLASRRAVSLGLAIGSSSILALGALILLIATSRARRNDVRRRLFNLQMLSHELRTPASAIRLNLEPLREAYDTLPPHLQAALMNTLAAEGRLSKVLEASTLYLQARSKGAAPEFHMEEVPLGDFIREVLANFGPEVTAIECTPELTAHVDRYWLTFCVMNLVDNALKHGCAPVRVGWGGDVEHFFVSVEDQGTFSTADLKEARQPFGRPTGKAGGIGLGLSLVYELVSEFGGLIEFKEAPTSFTLRFRR